MNTAEAINARQSLGLSQLQLALELGVTEKEVAAWEGGRVPIPKHLAERLAWGAALAARGAALEASGLPECAWVRAWQAKPRPKKTKARRAHVRELREHASTCPVCQARDAYAEEHLPPLPDPPVPGWAKALRWLVARVNRLPKWARPAAYGAVFIGGWGLLNVLARGVGQGFSLVLLETAGIAILAGGALGAVGGITYYAVREPFRRFGRAGDYMTGVAVTCAYLLAFAIPDALFSNDPMFRDPAGWIIFGILTLFFGLLIGHVWFRDV